jgi:hypothetical protein
MKNLIYLCIASALCLVLAAGAPGDPLFEDPVVLNDASGQPLVTRVQHGCPYAADYNNDGIMDIVLGAQVAMNSATGGIWLIPNTGTNKSPVFTWSTAIRVTTGGAPVQANTG